MEPGPHPNHRSHSGLARAVPAREATKTGSPQYPMTDLTIRSSVRPRPRPRSRLPFTLAIAVAFMLAVTSPGVVLGWDNNSFSSSSENEMLTLINQARAARGIAALNQNDALTSVARWRSKDM